MCYLLKSLSSPVKTSVDYEFMACLSVLATNLQELPTQVSKTKPFYIKATKKRLYCFQLNASVQCLHSLPPTPFLLIVLLCYTLLYSYISGYISQRAKWMMQ